MSRGRIASYLVVLLIGLMLGGALIGWVLLRQEQRWGARNAYTLGRGLQGGGTIPAAVRQVGHAVVQIQAQTAVPRQHATLPDLFRDLVAPPRELPADGSGVIVNARQGYVLTNAHVVRQARRIMVTLDDGRAFTGKVLGRDAITDLAVVQIPGGRLPYAALGDSTQVPIGAWVIAIGNPYGFQNTVTVGVVSAKNRTLRTPSGFPLAGLLQTDAAINAGNSGGALVDLAGNVVGIPTAVVPFAQGIGFAVAADTIKQVLPALVREGKVVRPWLGILYRERAPGQARGGLAVVKVVAGSPAARAGLQAGDEILTANGRSLRRADQLRQLVARARVGQRLRLTVRRGGHTRQITIRLGEMPAELPAQ